MGCFIWTSCWSTNVSLSIWAIHWCKVKLYSLLHCSWFLFYGFFLGRILMSTWQTLLSSQSKLQNDCWKTKYHKQTGNGVQMIGRWYCSVAVNWTDIGMSAHATKCSINTFKHEHGHFAEHSKHLGRCKSPDFNTTWVLQKRQELVAHVAVGCIFLQCAKDTSKSQIEKACHNFSSCFTSLITSFIYCHSVSGKLQGQTHKITLWSYWQLL